MNSSKPPALATWLVEHVIPGDNNEALAGDLMEQFRQGRSAGWYWRQAVIAVLVGCSKEFRILWRAIVITSVWTLALSKFYGHFWVLAQAGWATIWATRSGWAHSSPFTIGSFIVCNALPVALAVGMYLGLTSMFSLKGFLRGLSAGLLTMALCVYLCFMPSPKWLSHSHPTLVGYLVAALPVFFGLMVSMWAVRPNGAERRNMQRSLA